jgi:alpha-L-rhamnosidase
MLSTDHPLFGAKWIANRPMGGVYMSAPAPYFRKSFSVPAAIQSAQLFVTGLGLYECELNGQRIGDEVFSPGWTDYNKRIQYQTFDVTAILRAGENALGAIIGDGWYLGRTGWIQRQSYGDRPKFIARLIITLENGTTMQVVTDESWKTNFGPILENDFMVGESYDARLELGKWSEPGYDETEWDAVKVLPETQAQFVRRPGPPVRRQEELSAAISKDMSNKDSRHIIYDFGQNFSGRVRLEIEANPGVTFILRFAEVLNPDGTLYTANLRSARSTDYYTSKGGGVETWEPRFTFHGFRYVEVRVYKPVPRIAVTGIVLNSEMAVTGHFACSNPLLNQLQKNILWGQKSNFIDIPTDCPQRDERLGWTGDAQVFIRTAAFNMDVRAFFHKWMQDVRDAERPDGGVPPVIPCNCWDNDGGPAWSDATIICPWTIYLCYADKKILEDHYDSMVRYMNFMAEKRCKDGIREHPDIEGGQQGFGDWLALDGGGKTDGITPKDLIGMAFYAYDADTMAKIALLLGRKDDAARYRALRQEIGDLFQRRYITPEGLIASGTQTSYVLALYFDLVPEAVKPAAVRELVRHIEERKFHLATGFVSTSYVLDVLQAHGHLDVAYKLLEQETFPSWLFPVKNGATTIWERWDGWTPDKGFQDAGMNSFNHYAYGAVGAWMVKAVAGLDLDPAEPGYKHILFKPCPGGTLTWAEASLDTRQGKVSIRWDLQGETLKLQLDVPEDSRATLELPVEYDFAARDLKAGRHEFSASRRKN